MLPDRMRTDSQPDSAEGAREQRVPGATYFFAPALLAVAGLHDVRCVALALACWASWWLASLPEPEHPMVRRVRKHEAWWACYRVWRRAMVDWERRDRTRRNLALPRLPAPVPPWGSTREFRRPHPGHACAERSRSVPRLAVWL